MSSKKSKIVIYNLFLLFLTLSGCNSSSPQTTTEVPSSAETSSAIDAGFSGQQLIFNTHSESQDAFLQSADYQQWLIDNEMHGQGSNDRPKPATLTWNSVADKYRITISEGSDYEDPIIYEATRNKLDVHNLKLNTTYHIKLEYGDNGLEENTIRIQCDAPRILYISGIDNFRDEGGYPLPGGGYTRQGLIYRAARPNSVSTKGMKILYNELKLKTEIDLQTVGETGEDGYTRLTQLSYQFCPMSGVVNESGNDDSVRKVFSILADKANYPVYFHCAIGTDRTGYIGFLINGLLGVSYDHCLKDYLLSNFAPIGGQRSIKDIEYYMDSIQGSTGGYVRGEMRELPQRPLSNTFIPNRIHPLHHDSEVNRMICTNRAKRLSNIPMKRRLYLSNA